jgi:hypothetical protein
MVSIPSNKQIQLTFQTFTNTRIIFSVDYFPKKNIDQCHFYSYPYTMNFYENITNNFPGELFKCVQRIFLFDEHSFQHGFLLKISKAFLFLKELPIEN